MPTSDDNRYAQLLQNLAVRIGAIQEAIERAFGVTLPTAPTLNAEFEIITSAIYAAADRPRPVPLTMPMTFVSGLHPSAAFWHRRS